MRKLVQFLLLLLVPYQAITQSEYNEIILDTLDAKKIEWDGNHDWVAKVKHKKSKKWGMYQFLIKSDEFGDQTPQIDFTTLISPAYDNITFWNFAVMTDPYSYEISIVTKNKKKGILYCKGTSNHLTPENVNTMYFDEIEIFDNQYAAVRINRLWGLYDWLNSYMVTDSQYKSQTDIPYQELIDQHSYRDHLQKMLNADVIEFDPYNEDGVFRARNLNTKKWGIFQQISNTEINEIIPMQYDSVEFIPFNGAFTAVYNKGKVGFYLSKWSYEDAKQTVDCKYDDYQRFSVNGTTYLAVKRDNKWGWVDWLTGEEKSEFIYSTKEKLRTPGFKQNFY